MGKYINVINGKTIGASYGEKIAALINNGAERTDDSTFKENMICVVDNGFFAAAAYAYCESEFEEFKIPDGRPKQWFTMEGVSEIAE